ncbi:ethionine resistance protein [Homalodisca vitripennis]|nr:ethionine resistance protein [Homalodisca vitripennis]
MVEEDQTKMELEARLVESESMVRHYQTVLRDRDQELNITKRELKATNETLRALQTQLEKAFQNQNLGGPTNSTLTAILETKDARIATLEREVKLLEQELDRLGGRDHLMGSPLLDPSYPLSHHPLPQSQLGYKHQLDEFRAEIQRRDQEILAMSAKMKTLEEQHQDYQRHIAVLKESLCAKEEHYNMLQADGSMNSQRVVRRCLVMHKPHVLAQMQRYIIKQHILTEAIDKNNMGSVVLWQKSCWNMELLGHAGSGMGVTGTRVVFSEY